MEDYILMHHGILGQKWGVRRYQNKDGSLTSAGRKRLGYSEKTSANAKKVLGGIAIGAAVAAGTYLAIKNPSVRAKTLDFVQKAGKKTVASLGEAAKKTGGAMADAALTSIGTIAVAKIAENMVAPEGASEQQKLAMQVARDSVTAGVKANIPTQKSSNKSTSQVSGDEASKLLGAPSNKPIDKSGPEWQSLFKDSSGNQRDSETRAVIKSLASAGYDIEQIKKYLEIKHSAAERGMVVYGLSRYYIL